MSTPVLSTEYDVLIVSPDDDDDEGDEGVANDRNTRTKPVKKKTSACAFCIRHENAFGMLLCIGLCIVFYFVFQTCRLCVFGIFVVSICCCSRMPWFVVLLIPSVIVLFLNSHALRDMDIDIDIPVGQVIDNAIWGESSKKAASDDFLVPHRRRRI